MGHGGIAREDHPRGEEAKTQNAEENHPFEAVDGGKGGGAGGDRHGDDGGDGDAERHVVVDTEHVGTQATVDVGLGLGPGLRLVSYFSHGHFLRVSQLTLR